MNYNNQKDKTIIIKEKGKIHQIFVEDITHIIADVNILTFYFINEKETISISKSLIDFEKLLYQYFFFRIHRNTMINLKYLSSIEKDKFYFVILKNDTKLYFSKRKWEVFRKEFTFI